MTLANPDVLQLFRDVSEFEEHRLKRPLTVWRAWHNVPPKTSQLRALQSVQYTKELQIFGGNRSGKTELGRCLLVALVLGSDHPDARRFWMAHGVNPDVFPRGPDSGWSLAVTSSDSIRYHRKQVLALLPKWGPPHPLARDGRNWYSWNLYGKGEARIEVMVPGYAEPAQIWFKSEDQGEEAVQGDAVRVIHHDEEGKTGKVYGSASYRLIDKDGWQILTNTPIYGKTWTYTKFVEKPEPGSRLVRIHAKDNPYLPRHRVAKYGDDAVRGRGDYVEAEGRVWHQFEPVIHCVPRFELPHDAVLYRGIDFGTRHPFACLWAARLKHTLLLPNGRRLYDGTVVLYREHYQAERTMAWHVAKFRQYEGWIRDPSVQEVEQTRPHEAWIPGPNPEEIRMSWADPEDPQLVMQLNSLYGVTAMKARKALKAGIDMVASMLEPDSTGEPRLVIMDDLTNTIREISGYVWTKQRTLDGAEKTVPQDKDNHTCDCLRYIAMGLRFHK